ncbi:hypothetical protein NHX12_003170 [Muraenolepis orangiensis]|uniref:L-fucose kinase n=1 Tax=Muraenolepis orangiensis TaxID=630683 RepID=A0A9Q0IFG9_9TELE|nr:hypothetical protein NHX12_003170 [Muraenolepis orangiensis]
MDSGYCVTSDRDNAPTQDPLRPVAVAATAPRKSLGSSTSGNSGGGGSCPSGTPAKGKYAGGNPVCARPTPLWQKGIGDFFGGPGRIPEKENQLPLVEDGQEAGGSGTSSRKSRPLSEDEDESHSLWAFNSLLEKEWEETDRTLVPVPEETDRTLVPVPEETDRTLVPVPVGGERQDPGPGPSGTGDSRALDRDLLTENQENSGEPGEQWRTRGTVENQENSGEPGEQWRTRRTVENQGNSGEPGEQWRTRGTVEMVKRPFSWTVVLLTCRHKDRVDALQRELDLRQRRGSVAPGALLLTVSDPEERRLGSGGATLNALLVAAEHLSARAGFTVVSADVLEQAHILILHTGRDFPWGGCSRAFSWLAEEEEPWGSQSVQAPVCCLDRLLDCLDTQVCPGSPPGVWVCSTDMLLEIPADYAPSWEGFSGVRVLALPGDLSFAANHGVYLVDRQGTVKDIVYRGSREEVQRAAMSDGTVPMVSGVVFFSSSLSERLLQTHVTPPLDGCTYLGLDSGATPLQISLFLDVVKALCADLTQDQFVNREPEDHCALDPPQVAALRRGRETLWQTLRGASLTMAYVPGGRYDYLTLSAKEHVARLTRDTPGNRSILSHVQNRLSVSPGARVINSVLQGDVTVATASVVQHCHLQGPLSLPVGVLLSGLDLEASSHLGRLALADDIILQGHRIRLGGLQLTVYSTLGTRDHLEGYSDTVLNQNWNDFYRRTGIQPEDLWAPGQGPSLLAARLFPVLQARGGVVGLAQGGVAWLLGGAGTLVQWRGAWRLSLKELLSLTDQEAELRWREELLFLAGRRRVVDTLTSQSDACLLPLFRAAVLGGQQGALLRTLDGIAAGSPEGAGPGEGAGLDEGAGLGVSARALACVADVLEGKVREGVASLARERDLWLHRPDLLVRAARHYEGAGQVLLRRVLMTSQRFVSIGQAEVPPLGRWQEVECPARLDLAGGWSDTPPIAFEHGGSVTNVAVRVDGRRPIGARARRIREPRLLLVSHAGGRDSAVATETACDRLEDLKDHCQPHAPGTSSILAGALLAAVYLTTGQSYDHDTLIHAVLHLEQMLTTGGGWQDQVGGLVGGVKVARSIASLPLRVEVERLAPSPHFLDQVQRHLLLVYTGKTRLARNLLQNVHNLVSNSEECGLGACLRRAWQQKKVMVPGCEPSSVRLMMEVLEPLVLGQSLAGAGGGGFLYLLTRQPLQHQVVLELLNHTPGLGDFSVHSVELDQDGLTVLQPS